MLRFASLACVGNEFIVAKRVCFAAVIYDVRGKPCGRFAPRSALLRLFALKKRIVNKILNVGDGFPVPIYLEFVMFMFRIKKGR